MKVTIRPAARQDILHQYRYYLIEKGTELVAERFLGSVQSAVKNLCLNPGAGVPKKLKNPLLDGLRSWPVKGFPAMRVYYLYTETTVRILRVLHGKRDINPVLEDEE